jgi:hypothetical protein
LPPQAGVSLPMRPVLPFVLGLPLLQRRIRMPAQSARRPMWPGVGLAPALRPLFIPRLLLGALGSLAFPLKPVDLLPILPQWSKPRGPL